MHKICSYKIITQAAEGRHSGFKGGARQRTRTNKGGTRSTLKEDPAESSSSARNFARCLLEEILQNATQQEVSIEGVIDKGLLAEESFSELYSNDEAVGKEQKTQSFPESRISSVGDRPRQDHCPPASWTEPKRKRKIQTTSLVLRRRKKIKRRHNNREPELRLRGGNGEDSNGENDDDGGMDSNQDMRNPEEPSTINDEEGGCRIAENTKNVITHREKTQTNEDIPLSEGGGEVKNDDGKRPRERSSECEFFKKPKRPIGWDAWEDKTRQRPPPLHPPRDPDMEYANMTVGAIEDEDGINVFSQYKDRYMRSEMQLQAITDAHEDQRKVAGGVYRCLEKDQEMFELSIQKGFKSKTLGISLKRRQQGKAFSVFESFADMKYEYFRFRDGHRVRQECPEMTPTGYTWTGFGAEMALPDMPSSSIFVFCERVDQDIHFSQGPCERISEAPGASQRICSNAACGIVSWHLSRKCFQLGSDGQFREVWQEDFCLVTFKSNHQKLFWKHPNRKLKTSWWERYDSSPQYDVFIPDAGSRRRVQENLSKLPPWQFAAPTYTPQHQFWSDPSPLEREATNSCW